jgi:hypothetical protein
MECLSVLQGSNHVHVTEQHLYREPCLRSATLCYVTVPTGLKLRDETVSVERMRSRPAENMRTCEIVEQRQHLHFLSRRD